MQTKADILALINSLIADNTNKDITAEDVRTVLEALTNSSLNLVDDTNLFKSLPYLELDNPGGAIVAGDVGKFAMPDPSTAGAAAVYAWETVPTTSSTAKADLAGIASGDEFVIVDDANVTDATINIGTDVTVGATEADTVANLVSYINSNTSYTATSTGTEIIVTYKTTGSTNSGDAEIMYDSVGGKPTFFGFSGGYNTFDAPTRIPLGKIVEVTATTVTIDTITSVDTATAGAVAVSKGLPIFVEDGGETVVGLIELSQQIATVSGVSGSELGGLVEQTLSVGIAGESVAAGASLYYSRIISSIFIS